MPAPPSSKQRAQNNAAMGGGGASSGRTSTSGKVGVSSGKMGAQSSQKAAPAKTGSGQIGSKGGGASQQRPGQGQNAGRVTASTLGAAKTSQQAARNTALGKVAQAAKTLTPAQNQARIQAVSRGPGTISGTLPGSTNALAQNRTMTALRNSIAENPTFGVNYGPRSLNMLPKAVIGEAQNEGDVGRAAVANVMMNRLALGLRDPSAFGYMGAGSIPRMMRGIDAAGMDPNRPQLRPNAGFRNTVPGTTAYADGIRAVADSLSPYSEFSRTATPRTQNATHYYNPSISNPKWGEARSGTPFDTVGNHVFGNAERTAAQVASLRGGAPAGVQLASNDIGSIPRPVPRPDNLRPYVPRPVPRPANLRPERVLGVENYIDPASTISRNAFDGPRPAQYAGYGAFTPPAPPNAPLQTNPYEARARAQYSGYGNFTPPGSVGNVSRNAYDAARPVGYAGPGNFNVPDRTAPLSRNAFDTQRAPAPVNLGYGPASPLGNMPAQERPRLVTQKLFNDRVAASDGFVPAFVKDQARIAPSAPVPMSAPPPQGVTLPGPMPPAGIPPLRMSPFGNVGQEYHKHPVPPTPWQYRNEPAPAAPNLGTPASQTASVDDSQPRTWLQAVKDATGYDVETASTAVKQKTNEYFDAVKQHGLPAVQNYANQQAGQVPRSLTSAGPGARNPIEAIAIAQAMMAPQQQAQAQPSQAELMALIETMRLKGATPEEIAFVQSLIQEQTA